MLNKEGAGYCVEDFGAAIEADDIAITKKGDGFVTEGWNGVSTEQDFGF